MQIQSPGPQTKPLWGDLLTRLGALLALLAAAACGPDDDLGKCDDAAARELVYGKSGLVATKGQAIVHDTCGQGAVCHSASAKGSARHGNPLGLDFDMLPHATGLRKVLDERDEIWHQVVQGLMPPKGFAIGDGDWLFDVERKPGADKLSPLSTHEGKAVLRNWLACGAPIVNATKVPSWVTPSPDAGDPATQAWTALYDGLRSGCVSQGCHDGSTVQISLSLGASLGASVEDGGVARTPLPLVSGECNVYRSLMFNRDACGARLVVGGDVSASALMSMLRGGSGKLRENPECGDTTLHEDRADTKLLAQIEDWITAGAVAPQCGVWSDEAPRVTPVEDDASVAPASPKWSQLYSQVIGPSCATSGCHDAKSAATAGQLDLSDRCGARSALVNGRGPCGQRVNPSDEASMLVDKVMSKTPKCGSHMPPGGGLSSADAARIRDWVVAGAEADACP